jgi:hypothetical protein
MDSWSNPAYVRAPDLGAALLVTGGLVVLRLKLADVLGLEPAGPAAGAAPGVDLRFRLVLIIVAYIVIAVILRVLIRATFR